MNSVLATTLSAVYLAMRHIFPEAPLSAGAFEPLHGGKRSGLPTPGTRETDRRNAAWW